MNIKLSWRGQVNIRTIISVTAVTSDGKVIFQIGDGEHRPSTLFIPIGGFIEHPLTVDAHIDAVISGDELIQRGWRPPNAA